MKDVAIFRQRVISTVTAGMVTGRMRLAADRGQTMVEYALILGFIALAVVVALTTLGAQVPGPFNNVSNGFR